MSEAKKYIAVDSVSNTTDEEIHMTSTQNELCGTLKIVDGNTTKDVKDVFMRKDSVEGVDQIEGEEFTLNEVADKVNELLRALKGIIAPCILLGVLLASFSIMGADPEGKAKLGTIKASQYVVTNEVDGVFRQKWAEASSSIVAGKGASAVSDGSMALGRYANTQILDLDTPNSGFIRTINGYGYSYDFDGPTFAWTNATAYGVGAQARGQVSVAIGNRAMVSGLHGPSDRKIHLTCKQIEKITQPNGSISVTTTTVDRVEDPAKWESYPYPKGTFISVSKVPNPDGSITEILEEALGGERDYRYADNDEFNMYNIFSDPGQGKTNYKDATYGVAIGYRSLAGAYHTLALGHYARAGRPSSVAIGPSSHVLSEGAVGLGYYNRIKAQSPYSLALGSNIEIAEAMTNAIVIGVPSISFSRRFNNPEWTYEWTNTGTNYKKVVTSAVVTKPQAMKPNSINFVFNGKGLEDMFVDNVPVSDRIARELEVVGNTRGKVEKRAEIIENVNQITGIPAGDKSIVFVSGGGVKIYTENYMDELMEQDIISHEQMVRTESYGDVSQIEINGKKLSEILAECSNEAFDQYHATVTNAAAVALGSITNATNFNDVKNALTNFFNSIK